MDQDVRTLMGSSTKVTSTACFQVLRSSPSRVLEVGHRLLRRIGSGTGGGLGLGSG